MTKLRSFAGAQALKSAPAREGTQNGPAENCRAFRLCRKDCALCRFFLDHGLFFGRFRLRTAARTFGKRRFDLLDRLGLGAPLNSRNNTRKPVESRSIELALGIGLLRLRLRAIEIAHHLGDGDDIARIDLGLVFLSAARPHGALDAGATLERFKRSLDHRRLGELAHADGCDLGGRHPQCHLVLDEIDDKQLKPSACDLLFFDRYDLTHPVSRINDEFVCLEALSLSSLLRIHSQSCSFRLRLVPMRGLRHGNPGPRQSSRGMSGPPARAGGGFRCLPAHAGRTFLRTTTSFISHSSRVGRTPLLTVPRKSPEKICSRSGGSSVSGALFIMFHVYNTFSAKIKALTRRETVASAPRPLHHRQWLMPAIAGKSVAGSGIGREMLFEFIGLAFPFCRVRGRCLLGGNIRPAF